MASARFVLFILLVATIGALATMWLYPIIKRWWLKYTGYVERQDRYVEKEHKRDMRRK